MTTDRQRTSNASNAFRSTGPRTPEGKGRSSRNSTRHGLSATAAKTIDEKRYIEEIVRRLCADGTDVFKQGNARAFAEAQFDLRRVRRARTEVLARIGQVLEKSSPADLMLGVQALERVDRYERRLRTRMRRAVAAMSP